MRPRLRAAWLLPAAVVYTLFPIYGSLIPFVWQAVLWNDAIVQFEALLVGPLSLASRADFAANVLLAIPLATLWQAAMVGGRGPAGLPRQLLTATAVWLVCTALAVGLEFSQIFFSGRLPSLSDCVAQSIGAALGLLLWCWIPPDLWLAQGSARAGWRQLTALYLGGMSLYAVMPLDLTVSLSELAGKFSAGMVRLMPFAGFFNQPLLALIDALMDVGIWFVATLLVKRASGRLSAASLLGLWILALAVECAQLLVLSRVVDTTDIITAAIGIALGASMGLVLGKTVATDGPVGAVWLARAALPLLLIAVGIALRAYPFDFVTEAAVLRQRLEYSSLIPFASYTASGELYLVTNLLRRFFLFFVIGASVQWTLWATSLQRAWHTPLVAVVCAGSALIMTLMQLVLPRGYFDLGDVLFAVFCGVIAAPVARRLLGPPTRSAGATLGAAPRDFQPVSDDATQTLGRSLRPRRGRVAQSSALSQFPESRLRLAFWLGALMLPLVLSVVSYLPAAPYNVRELLTSGGWPWPVLPITATLLGLFGASVYIVPLAVGSKTRRAGQTTVCLFVMPLILALWLYLGVDTESAHDVVGSPVWGLWSAGEVVLRLAVLLLGLLWSFTLGVALSGCAVSSSERVLSSVRLLIHGFWVLPLWHAMVVIWAGTDNLTELMAGGGGVVASLCIAAYGVVLGWTTGACLRAMAPGHPKRQVGLALVLPFSALVGYGLAHLATEATLVKYDKVFSALQFLLSTDRQHYASGPELLLRFGLVHGATVVVAAVSMLAVLWVVWRLRGDDHPRGSA